MSKTTTVSIGNTLYEKNLYVIAQRDPALAQRLSQIKGDDNVVCESSPSKNGLPNLLVQMGDQQVFLHSRYDPAKEAEQLVEGVFDLKKNYYIMFGLGLGYPLEKLLEKTIDSDMVFLMEPNIRVFHRVLHERDLSGLFAKPLLQWSIGETPETAFSRWAKTYNISRMDGLGFVELPSTAKLSEPDYLKRFNTHLKGMLVTAGGNLQTLMIMAKQYQANTLHNIQYILKNPPFLSLSGKFAGKPAIIVSAGPSLDKNIDLLTEARDKALLIAVDTSLKPLRAKGIVPHLICTGDPQEANYRHLKDSSDCESYLIAEPMTNPKSFRDFDGRLFITSYGDKVVTWIENFTPKLGRVLCWGSVATMAFDVARNLGCDPIIFIGQDLSFPGGRTYAHGTYFETEEKRSMTVEDQERHGVYNVEDIYGNQITTNRQMFAYHRWFATEIRKTRAKVINATEGGILKEGVEILSLRETLDKYCGETFDSTAIIKATASEYSGFNATQLRDGLQSMVKDLREMRLIAMENFESAKEWLKSSVSFDVLPRSIAMENMNALEDSRKKLIAKDPAFKFVEMADQSAIKLFLKGYRMVDGKKIGLTSYKQVLEIYTKFYASMYRTINFQIPHFEQARLMVENFINQSEKSG